MVKRYRIEPSDYRQFLGRVKNTALGGKMIVYLYPVTLSIIIVNYNVKDLLEQCLHSVHNAIQELDSEVFVVDNASSDGSVEYLKLKFPGVTFIQNALNVGFSKANNQALEKCSGQFALFLNPDTLVPKDCFIKCVGFMDHHCDAGALGVRMVDGENKFLPESKRGLPTPSASFWKLAGISSMFPHSPIFAAYYAGHLNDHDTHKVEVLSGAFMLVRKSILDKIGGFDERYFMYAEDIDLSYRILKAGYNNYYFADTEIIHFKGSSTKKDFRYVKMFYKAMGQFVRKHYGSGPLVLLLEIGILLRGAFAAFVQLFSPKKNKIT